MLSLEDFSECLSIAIKKSGMKQAALAEKVGTSPANISNYVRAKSFPPLDILVEIAQELNVSIDSLCGIKQSHDSGAIKSLADVARLLVSFDDWKLVDVEDVNEDAQIYLPTITLRDDCLAPFINDFKKVKALLEAGTFSKDFYNRWLEDRLKSLSDKKLELDEHGQYVDYYQTNGLPFPEQAENDIDDYDELPF